MANCNQLRMVTAVMLMAAFVSGCQPSHAAEPMYKGRYLTDWLCCEPPGQSQTEAVLAIGTNGIPILLDILGAKDSTARKVASRLDNKNVAYHVREEGFQIDELTHLANKAFSILGTNAESAVPSMVKLLQDYETSDQAAQALADVGPRGFTALTNALTSDDAGIRSSVIHALDQIHNRTVTELLIKSLGDEQAGIRSAAALYLADREPDLVVPALTRSLDDSDLDTRQSAAITLGSYGPAARDSAEKILTIYTNAPNVLVFQALKKIDMDAAGKAETFIINSGPLNAARINQSQTTLKDGRILIAGGFVHTEVPTVTNHVIARAELLGPNAGEWKETGEMKMAREGQIAVLMQDGEVLVTGGADELGHPLASTEIYDPATGKWRATRPLNQPHGGGEGKLMPNGKILIYYGSPERGVKAFAEELYDPVTEHWTVVTNL
jgi:hypothetical protein